MDRKTARMASATLSTVGVLLMVAMAFGVLPGKYALFAGVACFILAGLMHSLAKIESEETETDEPAL